MSFGGRHMQLPDSISGVLAIKGDFGDAHGDSAWTSSSEKQL